MDRSLMCSPSASAARAPKSTARQFKTGNAPGNPRHTGHVFAFGSSPKRVEHPQKIFDAVLSCAWTSSPMMVSQLFDTLNQSFVLEGGLVRQSLREQVPQPKRVLI